MSLSDTTRADRVQIGIFGRRNSGKSSLINALTGQKIAIVSDMAGTTTDPVYKSMELLPIGPVLFIDTPGLDDVGTLGAERVKRAKDVIKKCDIGIVVLDPVIGLTDVEQGVLDELQKRGVPYITVFGKSDIKKGDGFFVSAKTGENITELKERIASLKKKEEKSVVRDLIEKGDSVVLVIPIDSAAPRGRIILPQQQVLREVLDSGAAALCVQPKELSALLENQKKPPKIVITDSQAFSEVSKIVPGSIKLTSFSILLARKKANFIQCLEGAQELKNIQNGDTVLISEGCTHHRQCDDIGTKKLPRLIKAFSGAEPHFEFTSGVEFPEDLGKYKLIVHCGGCMLTDTEVALRFEAAQKAGVSMTNYGIAIAKMNGILERVNIF